MKTLPDNSVDLVVTSPPYNNWRNKRTQANKSEYWERTNIDYGTYDDKMSDVDYFNWQVEVLDECSRILKDTGTIVYNHKDAIFNYEVLSPITWIAKSKCIYRQRVTWDRGGMQAFNPVRFYRVEEDIYILGKKAKGFKWNKDCARYLSIWKINPSSKKDHPASFPLEIPMRCIKAFTNEGDVVFDPFMGSGTTGLAAKELNRSFIGIELDDDYYKAACERINKETAQQTLF
tara:strand:- start:49 stop:744 length:696 start_codon:yes stop_codon:yes gene_type:complete